MGRTSIVRRHHRLIGGVWGNFRQVSVRNRQWQKPKGSPKRESGQATGRKTNYTTGNTCSALSGIADVDDR